MVNAELTKVHSDKCRTYKSLFGQMQTYKSPFGQSTTRKFGQTTTHQFGQMQLPLNYHDSCITSLYDFLNF